MSVFMKRGKVLVVIATLFFALGCIASCAHEHPSAKVPKAGKEHPSDTGGKEHPELTHIAGFCNESE